MRKAQELVRSQRTKSLNDTIRKLDMKLLTDRKLLLRVSNQYKQSGYLHLRNLIFDIKIENTITDYTVLAQGIYIYNMYFQDVCLYPTPIGGTKDL